MDAGRGEAPLAGSKAGIDAPASTTCPGCSAPLHGRYCAACGQRAPTTEDFTVRRFFGALRRELGDGDSRSWNTLRNVLVPGELTRAFMARQWQRYLPPLRLYLVLSGVFFLVAWDAYYALQVEQIRAAPAGEVPEQVRAVLENSSVAQNASDFTALARFAGVLFMALWLAVLHWRRRQPLGAHLVFATHYYCADYVLFTLVVPLLWLLPVLGVQHQYAQFVVLAPMLVLLAWTVLALRRVHQAGWPMALLGGASIFAVDVVLSTFSGMFGFGVAAGLAANGG